MTTPPVKPPSITDRVLQQSDLVLYEGLQPGMYTADLWFAAPPGGSGRIWLRAVDDGTGEVLSADSVEETTTVGVRADSNSAVYYPGRDNNVKIYEGEWGDPYVVRFELIYRPYSSEEQVVMSKRYLVEGWSR